MQRLRRKSLTRPGEWRYRPARSVISEEQQDREMLRVYLATVDKWARERTQEHIAKHGRPVFGETDPRLFRLPSAEY